MKRNAPQPLISADEYCIMRPPLMSLAVPISPPLRPLTKLPRTLSYPGGPQTQNIAVVANSQTAPSLAAIEAGEAKIKDHLEFFSEHFATVTRSSAPGPRLSNADFGGLYQRNQHEHGHHFVIHQHDHPVAGVHYDLRLQISKSSSISFAIIYGLPGNPNSMRLSRNATETRVHNLWVWFLLFYAACPMYIACGSFQYQTWSRSIRYSHVDLTLVLLVLVRRRLSVF